MQLTDGGDYMATPGIGDPYWFEWYVGLKYVIQMLNHDSGITSVTFQHPSHNTIDDVVVEYQNGTKQICYQVKHEISTSVKQNLTFAKLLQKDSDTPNSSCLLSAIMSGWKDASTKTDAIEPVLYTNRHIGPNRTKRVFNGQTYQAYPMEQFFSLLKQELQQMDSTVAPTFSDKNLALQWGEMCNCLGLKNPSEAVPFFAVFTIQGDQPNLEETERNLVNTLSSFFSCDYTLAEDLFSKLVYALRLWTTSRREDSRVTREDAYSALGTEEDVNSSQHRLSPPYPFFESRKTFCLDLSKRITQTDKKVVFLSGDPGSGKTSTISYLHATTDLFTLRYHTFRPISPEQHFYNTDAGMCSSENLWGTLLIQLRQKLKGKIAQYNIPVNNKLLTVEMMRDQVCRLLGIMAEEAITQNKRIYVCIDGIDHAARAQNNISFLSSLPTPDAIPHGVCFVIVGQPFALYQEQYPLWLSDGCSVEHLCMPKLCGTDITQLILSHAPQFESVANGLAELIFQRTDGNNLSTVFAIEEIKNTDSIEEATAIISASGVSSDIQQYYTHIWNHMKETVRHMNLPAICPESIVACPILLMNGRVNTGILARALRYPISVNDWKLILSKLYPLVVPVNDNGDYSLFHNDFRVFLMSIITGYQERYEETALALAEDLLSHDEGLLTYTSAIPLLLCANRADLIPQHFTPSFVINALAEGISRQRLDEFARLAYDVACENRNIDGYINTYLAIKSIHQHARYFEYYDKEYKESDYPEVSSVDISEIRVLPLTENNLEEYRNVLSLCRKLYLSGTTDGTSRSHMLYTKWFGSLSPYSLVPLCENRVSQDEDWHLNTDEVGFFLKHWGKISAEIGIELLPIDQPISTLQQRALVVFGEAYYETSIDIQRFDCALNALKLHYVHQGCFTEKLESILYAGKAQKVEPYLSKVSIIPDKPSLHLLARAMLVTCQQNVEIDLESLTTKMALKHAYDESVFAIILHAFLLGHCEKTMDDAVICGHVESCYSSLEEKEPTLSQVEQLSKYACLLGKYYWDSTAVSSDNFVRFIHSFLTTKLWRRQDYSKAKRFLLFVLLQSPAGSTFSKTESFFSDLKTYLFEIDNLGMYYKTCILDYLSQYNKLDIIKEYILALYGEECREISINEDRVRMHSIFKPYGDLVLPDMMQTFSAQLKWDVIGYSGHKEYVMQAPAEYFEQIAEQTPELWQDLGLRLYHQSKIAEVSSNRCASSIRDSIIKAAVSCGINSFWRLRSWDNEFRLDPDVIYNALFEFIKTATDAKALEAIWVLNCGIHSWYTQEERIGSKCIFEACSSKGQELGINFHEIASTLTPQWVTIVEQESKEYTTHAEPDSYSIRKAAEIEGIREEYNALSIDELISLLPGVPSLNYPETRYNFVIEKLKAEDRLSQENAEAVLRSACTYLEGKQWPYERFEDILSTLLILVGEDAFWALANSIGKHLNDYEYQTSTRNTQLLLKLFFQHNYDQMRVMFDQELLTQELWVTGNAHIPTEYSPTSDANRFNSPENIAEMALYILLEQISTRNARKMEMAFFAISVLGRNFDSVLVSIAKGWSAFSNDQKDALLLVITRWVYDGIDIGVLKSALNEEDKCCDLLPRKYYLHSLFQLIGDCSIDQEHISCAAQSMVYSLPQAGYPDPDNDYESFLYLSKEYGISETVATGIRRYIAQSPVKKKSVSDPYDRPGDIHLPIKVTDVDRILYDQEKHNSWRTIPLSIKKSRILPVEDPLLLTEMPHVVYDEDWFPNISANNNSQKALTRQDFSAIARRNLSDNETLLAACIWYPWGHEAGAIFFESTKVSSVFNPFQTNDFDWCLSNFALLARESSMSESRDTTLYHGGVNLFNRLGGRISICFGNSIFIPSSIWRELFRCYPSPNSPYTWQDSKGTMVLRFERFISPTRDATHELYIRQPILFRWVCESNWLEKKLKRLGLKKWQIHSIENYPR